MPTMIMEEVGATDLLKKEHKRIKDFFRQFEDATSDRQKKLIGDNSLREIEIHAALEEEIFYPAVRRFVGERQQVVQALASHHVAKFLVKELKNQPAGEHYNACFELLKDNILQHIEDEESDMLPHVENSELDQKQVAEQMVALKERYVVEGASRFTRKQKIAMAAAGVAAVGAIAYFTKRAIDNRRTA